MEELLTFETYVDGRWQRAAQVEIARAGHSLRSKSKTVYDKDYVIDQALATSEANVRDRRALSVTAPVSLDDQLLNTWPAWLVDLIPQGQVRKTIEQRNKRSQTYRAPYIALLYAAFGSPIGNLRIPEAYEIQQDIVADIECPPLTDKDLLERTKAFRDMIKLLPHIPGASGLQGEWPKFMLTRHQKDQLWYPDPYVPTGEGCEHVIIKMEKSKSVSDRAILASEAPYMRVAQSFGLNVHKPLTYTGRHLIIPRFDREWDSGRVLVHGQESLVSTIGIPEFGYLGRHEHYLKVIQTFSDDPAQDTIEYVLRDVLNEAMGNPDNHGRNTALRKHADGGIRLAPLFDFAPMKLSDVGIGRSTRWECRRRHGGWSVICKAAACDAISADELKDVLRSKIAFLRDIRDIAHEAGVDDAVAETAIHGRLIAFQIEKMR